MRILTDSSIVVNRIMQLLDEEQIPSIVKDNVESARLAGFGTPTNNIDLYVNKSDVDRAEEILKSFMKEHGK
ncbi:MAG: putative signal transducing protein [Cryomorphaceae bacterium]